MAANGDAELACVLVRTSLWNIIAVAVKLQDPCSNFDGTSGWMCGMPSNYYIVEVIPEYNGSRANTEVLRTVAKSAYQAGSCEDYGVWLVKAVSCSVNYRWKLGVV